MLIKRFYTPRLPPAALRSVIGRHRKGERATRKAIIDAVCAPPLDPDADAPFSPVQWADTLKQGSDWLAKPKWAFMHPTSGNVERVLAAAGVSFCKLSLPDACMYVVQVEAEPHRRAIVDDLQSAFKRTQVDPQSGPDGGWTCCAVAGCTVHLLDSASFTYYNLAGLWGTGGGVGDGSRDGDGDGTRESRRE